MRGFTVSVAAERPPLDYAYPGINADFLPHAQGLVFGPRAQLGYWVGKYG
jgi:hypothetical protein